MLQLIMLAASNRGEAMLALFRMSDFVPEDSHYLCSQEATTDRTNIPMPGRLRYRPAHAHLQVPSKVAVHHPLQCLHAVATCLQPTDVPLLAVWQSGRREGSTLFADCPASNCFFQIFILPDKPSSAAAPTLHAPDYLRSQILSFEERTTCPLHYVQLQPALCL